MASILKAGDGWRVQLTVKGRRDSRVFPTKREASSWAEKRGAELRAVTSGHAGTVYTLQQAMEKYSEEVSSKQRGARWEMVRLKAFQNPALHGLPIKKALSDISKADVLAWRNRRLQCKAPDTVRREMGLLSSVFKQAISEWEWIDLNPMTDVKKPPKGDHRTRVISPDEVRAVLRALGHVRGGGRVATVSQAVARAFLASLATGMRAGEVCSLKWADVHNDCCTARDVKSIRRGQTRDVPLSRVASKILQSMRGWDDTLVFGVGVATLDTMFRRARRKAGVDGFTFHDARRTAATRISKKIHVLTLCKMFGWTDPKMAMVYYSPKSEDVAALLDRAE